MFAARICSIKARRGKITNISQIISSYCIHLYYNHREGKEALKEEDYHESSSFRSSRAFVPR
jgi:hypothetical protein